MHNIKLGEIVDLISVSVSNPQQSVYKRFVGLEHYDSGEPRITRFQSTDLLTSTAKEFRKNDILIARRNVYLKRAGIVDFDGLTSGDSLILRIKTDIESKVGIKATELIRIIPWILNSNDFWSYANKHADGMNSKRISKDLVMEYEFTLPNISELTKLTDKLWAAYRLKEAYKRLLVATDEMVKSQFTEMFDGKPMTSQIQDCFVSVRNGANIKQGQISGGIPITRIETISEEFVDRKKMGYAGIYDSKYESYYLQDNDILMSHINSLKHIGKCALFHKETNEIIIHGMNLICLRPNKDTINPVFAIHMLRSDRIKNNILDITKPAVNQASFSIKDFCKSKIYIPPMSDQIKFAMIAEQADKSKFDGFKSQFTEMFGRNEEIDLLPKAKVKDLFQLSMGKTPSRKNEVYWIKSGIPWVSISDMGNWSKYTGTTSESISMEAVRDTKIKVVPKGNIIMSFKLSIGRVCITSQDLYTNEAIMAFIPKSDQYNIDFLHFYMSMRDWTSDSKQAVKGATLNKESIGETVFIVPPVSLQNQFAEIVRQADKSKYNIHNKI